MTAPLTQRIQDFLRQCAPQHRDREWHKLLDEAARSLVEEIKNKKQFERDWLEAIDKPQSLRSETERSPESYEGQIKAQHQVIAKLQAKAKRWQEIALKLAGAECFIEEQRKKGNIK